MWTKGFTVLPSGVFALSGGIVSNSNAVHMFGPRGELISSWGDTPMTQQPQARWIGSGGPLVASVYDELLYAQAAPVVVMRRPAETIGSSIHGDTVYADRICLRTPVMM